MLDRTTDLTETALDGLIDILRASTSRPSCSTCRMSGRPGRSRLLIGADEIVIVATPDLASLRNAKNLFDVLRGSRARTTRGRGSCSTGSACRSGPRSRRPNSPRRSAIELAADHAVRRGAVRHGRQQRPDDRRGAGRRQSTPRLFAALAAGLTGRVEPKRARGEPARAAAWPSSRAAKRPERTAPGSLDVRKAFNALRRPPARCRGRRRAGVRAAAPPVPVLAEPDVGRSRAPRASSPIRRRRRRASPTSTTRPRA